MPDEEYKKMLEVYKEMLRQLDEIKKIKRKFKKYEFTTSRKHVIEISDIEKDGSSNQKFVFDKKDFDKMGYEMNFVKVAELKFKLKRTSHFDFSPKITVSQIVLHDEETVIDTVDTSDNFDEVVDVTIDVTDTVQAWLLDPETQRGLTIQSEGFEIIRNETIAPSLTIDSDFSLTRQKRSLFPGFFHFEDDTDADTDQDCDATENKCCRDNMVVNLRELEGFNFILEPTEFNAYMCRGRCPARYRPMTDHSLLQSLMHIKNQQDDAVEFGSNKVKRPCCVPSKLSSLPILHLDEKNPSKLKVTTWKSVIVTECACA